LIPAAQSNRRAAKLNSVANENKLSQNAAISPPIEAGVLFEPAIAGRRESSEG